MNTPFAELLATDLDAHFPAFVRAKQDRLYAGIRRLIRQPEDAADVTQETFVRAYRALGSYERARISDLSLDGWLWTIALNLCRSRASRKRPALVPIVGTEATTPSAEREAMIRFESDRLVVGLRSLSGPQREAIVLHHIAGLPYQEVAEVTGRPVGTLKAQVSRGLTRLAVIMEETDA